MSARFYVDTPFVLEQEFTLPDGAARHVKVRRLQPEDDICIFNGISAGFWHARILKITKKDVIVKALEFINDEENKLPAVELAFSVMAFDRMDWLLEKSCELGAAKLTPLYANRTVIRLSGERLEKKISHWQAVIAAAGEQCGRNTLPKISPPLEINDFLKTNNSAGKIILSPAKNSQSFSNYLKNPNLPREICLLSGSEGGFTDEEEKAAINAGFTQIKMGQNILRAETAPIAALSLILFN